MDVLSAYGVQASGSAPEAGNDIPVAVGLEVELEDVSLSEVNPGLFGWTLHEDGSLRNCGVEFVFSRPASGAEALANISSLTKLFSTAQASPRTSVHIHTDMTWTTVEHVQALAALVYLIEDGLFRYANEDRKWCGYSMALESMPEQRLQSIFSSNIRKAAEALIAGRREERYYGLNTHALSKFGTLEWRYFPGTYNTDQLTEWSVLVSRLVYSTKNLTLARVRALAAAGPTAVREYISSFLRGSVSSLLGYIKDDEVASAINTFESLANLDLERSPLSESLVFYSGPLEKYLARAAHSPQSVQCALSRLHDHGAMTYGEFSGLLQEELYAGSYTTNEQAVSLHSLPSLDTRLNLFEEDEEVDSELEIAAELDDEDDSGF